MKKQGFMIVIVLSAALLMGCGNAKVQELPGAQPDESIEGIEESIKEETTVFKKLENVFAFADESGKRLITLQNENGDKLLNPEAFNKAIGNNGEMLDIVFVKRQEANSMDTLRQSIYNFDNMAGYIYEATEGELIPNKTYMISAVDNINKNAFIKLISARDTESTTEYYKKTDIDIISKVEKIKARKIVKSRLISETAEHAQICLFIFERKEEDMLASIAYIDGDKAIFKDYPAKYDEMSTWRVDAGDEPGLFEVLFLANSDEGLLLGLTWAAPEGENIFVLKESDGVFEKTGLSAGRYWAP